MAPAKSRRQARLMGAAAGGKAKIKGLSKEEAKEYIRGQKMKGLPEKVKSKNGSKKRGTGKSKRGKC